MILAASQRQSSLLFEKVRGIIEELEFKTKKTLLDEKPTLTKMYLKNGSKLYCFPAGRTGHFIRGYTIDLLIIDEAAFLPETVYLSISPMIAVSKKMRQMGHMILLSTPFGKGGYFYNSFTDKDFKPFHVSSEDCKRIPKAFLRKEKLRMTKAEYRQEYMGDFTDEWNQLFPTALIKDRMTFIEWDRTADHRGGARYYLGVDIARYGGDENAFVICEMYNKRYRVVKCFTTDRVSTTDTIGRIEIYDNKFNFGKIFIDDSGVGGSVTDILIERLGRKVIGLNNASKRFEIQGEEKKRGILKEDLYSNALMLMETKLVELIAEPKLMRSLKSVTFEYGQKNSGTRRLKIFGDYTHLSEALVRALWCHKERGLNLYMC